jgi:hypothetical protein
MAASSFCSDLAMRLVRPFTALTGHVSATTINRTS